MTNPIMLIARLYEHIEPLDRGSRYEDPLDAALRHSALGEVTGGGSQLSQNGEIEFADVEISVASLDDAVPTIIRSLEASGAPVGSQILGDTGVIREFGLQQSVAVYLDGVTLPDDVYANLDFDEIVRTLTAAAGDGSYHGYWQGAEETGLFFFGRDAGELLSRIEPALRVMPIGQNAHVVVRPGRDRSGSRTVRMPRH
jgi:hypothetical protein